LLLGEIFDRLFVGREEAGDGPSVHLLRQPRVPFGRGRCVSMDGELTLLQGIWLIVFSCG
jgi:hypothetical protein